MEDYRALRGANARFLGTVSQPVGPLEQDIMTGNRVFLQARERITLPFRLQSFQPPDPYKTSPMAPEPPVNRTLAARVCSSAAGASAGHGSPGPGGAAALHPSSLGHTVAIEMMSTKDDVPVAVLELEVVPRPVIIDRTFR